MSHSAKTRQALIYVLIAALAAPLLLLELGPSAGEPAPRSPGASQATLPMVAIDFVHVGKITETSAMVSWHTNVPTDSQVTFGEDNAYERGTRRDLKLRREHRVVVKGLESGVTYQACVVSTSADGRIGTASGITLRTLGVAGFRDLMRKPDFAALRLLPTKASGVAVWDYDNDGDLDLFVCSEKYRGSRLLRNDNGKFTDVTEQAGVKESARAATWADFDGDGDADLALSSGWKLHLFENTGAPDWKFAKTAKVLPRQPRYSSEGIGWLDYDRDGRADLMVANGPYGLLLYHNTGHDSPRLADVSKQAGLGRRGIGAGLGDYPNVADLNGDGWPDFVYSIRGRGCLLAFNSKGKRFAKASDAGLDFQARHRVGLALGDYDNDGDLDVCVPMSDGNRLFRNDAGKFTDVTAKSGELKGSAKGCSAAWGDVDNDGDLDLYVARWYSPDVLYVNNGDGTFRDGTAKYRLSNGGVQTARGIVMFDFDHDGDLDIFVNNRRSANFFYVNQTVIAGQHDYLLVEFAPKVMSIGAKVTLLDSRGKLVGYREVGSARGWGSQAPPIAHFGCKPAGYKLRVVLSDGKTIERNVTTTANGPNVVRIE